MSRINIYIHKSNYPFIELTSFKASKLKALQFIVELSSIEHDQFIAIGDGANDVEMLNHFTHTFMMNNGTIWGDVNQIKVKKLKSDNSGGYLDEIFESFG